VTGGDVSTCWRWTGAANRRTGYGKFSLEKGRQVLPHRFAYESLRSEIPAGLQIDHLCRVRLCVNPWHMEPVTARVNILRSDNPAAINARREACQKGHPFTEENTYRVVGKSYRKCATCHKARARSYRVAQRTEKPKAVTS
jgi:hypothetical protein